jgi:[histone H3]-lysine36 N-dimethyltransferase SETMAR
MDKKEEQRVCIKFCVKNDLSSVEIFQMLQVAFKEQCLSRAVIYLWIKRFKEGRESVKDDERSGRPVTSVVDLNVSIIRDLILEDNRLTIRELADDVGISYGTCQSILTETLEMRRVAAKFVPRLLTDHQREHRMEICAELKQRAEIDPNFINSIITGDETWLYGYDPETKAQSSVWQTKGSPRVKKCRQVRSNVKSLLTVFFDSKGVIHHEFLPKGQTVNQVYYKQVLLNLLVKIRKKRPEMWTTGLWFLQHDNAPAHTALSIRDFLAQKQISVLPHPPYSPDLAPCDFFLFPKIKLDLKGKRFDDIETIQSNLAAQLKRLTPQDFQHCFEQWYKRWDKCISSEGHYFEDD